eukprot:6492526-Amphidinium_carterae.2
MRRGQTTTRQRKSGKRETSSGTMGACTFCHSTCVRQKLISLATDFLGTPSSSLGNLAGRAQPSWTWKGDPVTGSTYP